MEGCRKKVVGWWKTSAASTRLLWFMVPLMVVSGVVVLGGGPKGNSGWAFGYNCYYPWILNVSVTTTTPLSARGSDFGPVSLANNSGVDSGVTADNQSLNRSGSPPEILEAEESQQPVTKEEENFNVTAARTDIIPSFNETHSLPLSARIKGRFSNLERLEARLGQARAAIRAAKGGDRTHDYPDYIPSGPIYWNANAFHRSYLEMEKQFKIYVYEEGEPPIFHNGPCKSIYAMEGNFIYNMETSQFRTRDPDKAHIYFLPMSITQMVHFIYESNSHDWLPMRKTVKDYVNLVANRYPYWNRSIGADHFMLSCHDWGPELSRSAPELYKNSIRALCNANTSEGFNPSRDVSIPEILLPGGTTEGLLGGPSPSRRPYLVFFAGGLHGPIRPILLQHWEDKDEDVQVHKYLKKGVSYYGMLRKSKYCICASGYEVASPRMVEALYTGCVPVLIKDHYVAPFSDVLNWKSFAVEIPVADIPNMKAILSGISSRQYIRMQRRGKQVRQHFEVNLPPRRYDVFHMILHSVWLRRLNIRLHGVEDS